MVYRIDSIAVRPLSVPLTDPFTIASGRMVATRAALVEATLVDERNGARATGLGEAAALPPVTHEDQPDLIDTVRAFARRAHRLAFDGAVALEAIARITDRDDALAHRPVARSAIQTALLDAAARHQGVSLYRLLMEPLARDVAVDTSMQSDITIPIHDPAYMGELAIGWARKGFSRFKVKVGLDLGRDLDGLANIHARVPAATFLIDANGGYNARAAIDLYVRATRAGVVIECFEQPCARDDLDGMATVTREIAAPVIADESLRDVDDLHRIVEARAATGVNLKLVKLGGPVKARAIGRAAKELDLDVMMGAMVETRLGITSAAHVCVAIGGARFVDLDTAWLMREDPFVGGYRAEGPDYELPDAPGQAIEYAGAELRA
jgi:L-Ala-D/L-Glu epimerase